MRHHLGTPIYFAATLTLAALGPSCDSPTQRALTTATPDLPDDPQIHAEVLSIIHDHYFQPVSPDTTLTARKMMSHLDPFSHYVTHAGYDQSMRYYNDEGYRFGLNCQRTGRHIIITTVVLGSAAEEAGLQPGDELIALSNRAVNGNEELVRKTLTENESVEFGILRSDSKRMKRIRVHKASIEESSVPLAVMFDSNIGFIGMTGFHHGTTHKLHKALEYLAKHGMRSLILDMRGNPGGLVDETLASLNLFVHSDTPVVREISRDPNINSEHALTREAPYASLPLVVLVGNYTCSAAEMFAGTLQDLDRATIIGQPTVGKSLVMRYFPLSNQDQLFLTIAEYSLPSGRTIQRPYFEGQLIGGTDRDFGSFDDTDHAMDSAFAEGDCPTHHTRLGHSVTGSNGIVPDYFVAQEVGDSDWLADAEETAAAHYIHENAEWLLSTTIGDFTRHASLPEELVASALNVVRAHDTTVAKHASLAAAWQVAKDIKARIAYDIWEERGYFQTAMRSTAAIRRAVSLLTKPAALALVGN